MPTRRRRADDLPRRGVLRARPKWQTMPAEASHTDDARIRPAFSPASIHFMSERGLPGGEPAAGAGSVGHRQRDCGCITARGNMTRVSPDEARRRHIPAMP